MIKTSLKNHWPILIIALAFGALAVLPFFYFQIKAGPDFQGILPSIVNDDNFYYARIRDVVDGHQFLSNAYLWEHKNALPQQVFLAEWLSAQPLKILNISVSSAHLFYNFILPIISLLLCYWTIFLISKSRFWAAIISIFLFFGLFPADFTRPISPQFNFIFWLFQFIFLWLFLNDQDSKKLLFLNILNFGLLFYIYPYYWTFYIIFFGILAAAYRLVNSRELFLKITAIIFGGLVLAVPYFYFNYLASRLPEYSETLTRLGMIYTRFPSGIRIVFWSSLGLAIFTLAIWKKIIKWDRESIFWVSGIASSIIAVNQHVLTGKNIEFSSHYNMTAIFFLTFAMAYLWSKIKIPGETGGWLSITALVLVTLSTAAGVMKFSNQALAVDDKEIYQQKYAAVFKWLNGNTSKDSVVYADQSMSRLIPVYTANNVFYVREANLFYISDEEAIDRFILNNFFEKFTREFIIENVRSVYGARYIDEYGHAVQSNKLKRLMRIKADPEIYLPEAAAERVVLEAKKVQSGDFIGGLKKYRVDYLVKDKNKDLNWEINSAYFKPVFENKDFIIYGTNFR